MTFSDDIRRFNLKVEGLVDDAFVNIARATHESIVLGSTVTGAPGQPVDTGNLRSSWQLQLPERGRAIISTNVAYAPYVEAGISRSGKPVHYHNHGPHSVALTIAGFPRIVADEVRKLKGGG